ncbi:FliO/MopB family protein [Sphingomonas sp. AP4-R1]|nr:FliO/MopB family protein [Sphingomonas sp. AP4-R1]
MALSGLFGTIIALAVVLGLAFFGLKAMRRWQDGTFRSGGTMPEHPLRFIRALPVGQRERVMLIEAKGEVMLIGVSGGAVTLLKNWGDAGEGPSGGTAERHEGEDLS